MTVPFECPVGVTERIHGVDIYDPYRWLEDRFHPATQEWILAQQRHFDDYFMRVGSLDSLKTRIRQYLDVETVDQIGKVHDRYFFRKRRVGEQQPSIYVACAPTAGRANEKLLVDSLALGKYESAGIHRIDGEGRFLAYELKYGGEHTKEIHVIDVNTGERSQEFLGRGYARGFAFRASGDGFYYSHEVPADHRSENADHIVRLHHFGTNMVEDEILLSLPRLRRSKVLFRSSGNDLSVSYYHGVEGRLVVDFYLAKQGADRSWTRVCHDVPAPFAPFLHRGRLFARLAEDGSNGKIVELDISTGRVCAEIVPESDDLLVDCVIAGTRIFVTYTVGNNRYIKICSLCGDCVSDLPLRADMTWALLPAYVDEADELFLASESFTTPPALHRYRVETGDLSVWTSLTSPAQKISYFPHRINFSTPEDVEISLTLLGPRDITNCGCRPMIMTAYGASGVTLTPQFSVFAMVMMELGYLVAIPEIRGGGERGHGWREAAKGRNKQIAFDDFIYAAEWLCGAGYTSPAQLAIFGGSFSGLLVGAVLTQRPSLFRAAVCLSPLLDMLRYHLFDRAETWSSEYGTIDGFDDFIALHRYSPYHNVQEQTNYPAVLFVTGDKDSRCNPAHARKMTALLQDRPSQKHSILIDHKAERGHSPTLPLSFRVDALAQKLGFLCNELSTRTYSEDWE